MGETLVDFANEVLHGKDSLTMSYQLDKSFQYVRSSILHGRIKKPKGADIEVDGIVKNLFGKQFCAWLNFAACVGFSYAQTRNIGSMVDNYQERGTDHFLSSGMVNLLGKYETGIPKVSRENMRDLIWDFDYEVEDAAKYGIGQGVAKKVQGIKDLYAPELMKVELAISEHLKTKIELEFEPEKGVLRFKVPDFDQEISTHFLANEVLVSAAQIDGLPDRKKYGVGDLKGLPFATQLFKALTLGDYSPVIGTEAEFFNYLATRRKTPFVNHIRQRCSEVVKGAIGQEAVDALAALDGLDVQHPVDSPEISLF